MVEDGLTSHINSTVKIAAHSKPVGRENEAHPALSIYFGQKFPAGFRRVTEKIHCIAAHCYDPKLINLLKIQHI
jgi:hypothetical protein